MQRRCQSMRPHRQQTVFSLLLLGLSLLLLGALTLWHTNSLLGPLVGFFLTFFDCGAYLIAIALIVFSFAHLIEGTLNIQFIRWSMVMALLVLLLLLLAETQLILHVTAGG